MILGKCWLIKYDIKAKAKHKQRKRVILDMFWCIEKMDAHDLPTL